jgi:hypothetical protein
MKEFKLENRSKIETGFKTPDHYFENFSESILLKTSKNESKVIPLFQKRKILFAMFAAILVIALMLPIINTPAKISEEIDTTTIENYLSYQSAINQYDLINVLESEDIYSITTPTALENETIEDILVFNANLEHLIIE